MNEEWEQTYLDRLAKYHDLIDDVARIDCDAAEKLRNMPTKELSGFWPSWYLRDCFVLGETKEGLHYWLDINKKVENMREAFDITERTEAQKQKHTDDIEKYYGMIGDVAKIDIGAALSLRNMTTKNVKLNYSGELNECFYWGDTEEGFDYWHKISNILDDTRNEPKMGRT